MSHHIIEVDDLHYTYPDGTQVLKGISFRITHGEKVALVGANGAGKSTLLLQFNGCLLPEAGRVRIGEMPVTKKTLKHVRRTVGLIFQDPDDQLFMPLVYDDVAFGPLNLGLSPGGGGPAGDAGPGRGGRRPPEGPPALPSVRRGKARRGHRRGVVPVPGHPGHG